MAIQCRSELDTGRHTVAQQASSDTDRLSSPSPKRQEAEKHASSKTDITGRGGVDAGASGGMGINQADDDASDNHVFQRQAETGMYIHRCINGWMVLCDNAV